MKEDFLHYLWRFRAYKTEPKLQTVTGEKINVQETGIYNTDAGPDFSNARIRIGDTLWAGHVEMHLKTSDWLRHGHQHDDAYKNVILHVVYEHDVKVPNTAPVLELRPYIPTGLLEKYRALLHNKDWIPCAKLLKDLPEHVKTFWIERLMIERLEQKTEPIQKALEKTENHWEIVFYQFLARSFGGNINGDIFERLSTALPLTILAKHKNNLFQIEALLFGQAGFLQEEHFKEEYTQKLKAEYDFLKIKYDLQPLPVSLWKFARMRPANFPTVRLAQFADLIHRSSHLFSKVLEAKDIKILEDMLSANVSEYWETHYQFEKQSSRRPKHLGKDAVELLIVNTIAPFVFWYGYSRKEEIFQDKALAWLSQLSPESNTVIEQWNKQGIIAVSAYETQALLQLKKHWCDAHRCLQCSWGANLMKYEV